MQVFQHRLDSFLRPKRVKTGPKSTTSLKWPHPKQFQANPETLAEAGFYFDPSVDDKDLVTCYMCGKQLGEWAEDDDPFEIHLQKCAKTCSWAFLRCGLSDDLDVQRRFSSTDKTRHPTSKAMEKARLDTFGKWWKYDGSISSKKMAQAGFIYSPLDDQDDLVICVYCDTSLSGWEKDDDPLEEHRKRAEKAATHCAFFDTGKSLGRSRSKTADVVMPTKTFDGGDSEEETARTTAKTPRASRSVAKGAKTPRARLNRSVSQTVKTEEEDEEEEITAPPRRTRKASSRARAPSDEDTAPRTRKASTRSRATSADDSEEITAPAPRTRKSTRAASRAPSEPRKSRAKAKPVPETEEEAEEEDDDVPDMAPVKPPRSKSRAKTSSDESEPPRTRKTSTRIKGKAVDEALGTTKTPKSRKQKAVESEEEEEEEPKKSMRASRSKAPPPPKAEDDDEELPAASTSKKPTSAKTRAKSKPPSVAAPEETLRKSTRKGKAKEDAPLSSEQRTISRSKSKLKVEDSDDDLLVVQPTVSKTKKPTSRVKPTPSPDESNDIAPAKNSTKVKEVERKPKKKKAEKVVEDSTDGEDVFMDAVEEQVPSRPASRLTTAKPGSRKIVEQQQAVSKVAKAPPLEDAPIVLSSDAEEEPPKPPSKPVSNVGKLATKFEFPKKASLPERPKTPPRPPRSPARPLSPVRAPLPPPPEPMDADVDADADVDMEDYIPEEDNAEIATQPVTPPRPSPPPAPAPPIPMSNTSLDMNLDAFIPALSTTPFVPLDALSEAELAMTVEEWIRFHMLLECDKFARDGEKEVLKFECKAQEVQRMLEAL